MYALPQTNLLKFSFIGLLTANRYIHNNLLVSKINTAYIRLNFPLNPDFKCFRAGRTPI